MRPVQEAAMKFTPEELRNVAILEGLPDPQIEWFAEHAERVQLASGQRMFERGQPAEFMFIVVDGAIEGYEEVGGQELLVATTCAGQVTGMLPFSRMTHYPRYTVAIRDSVVLTLEKKNFPEMLVVSEEIGRRLVAVMSDRVRGDVRLEQQQEKMAALGRLSAGLAHELNNPAAAIKRAADGAGSELDALTDLLSELAANGLSKEHVEVMGRLRGLAASRADGTISPLARSDREDALGEWLEERGVADAWNVAGTLMDAGLAIEDFDEFDGAIPGPLQAALVRWLACTLDVGRCFDEIGSSAARISDLIRSVKLYSHMDRSSEHRSIDVRDGIRSTLTLLAARLREKEIKVVLELGERAAHVTGHPGELNQVWTHLTENAIEAVEVGGEIRLRIHEADDHVNVSIIDDGKGIPDDARNRIFEPFFTTKAVGEGAGLGLDIATRIVRTHRGTIYVDSKPGRTEFKVQLPAT